MQDNTHTDLRARCGVRAPTYKNYLLLVPVVVTVTSSLSSVISDPDLRGVVDDDSVLLTLTRRCVYRWLTLFDDDTAECRWLTRNVSRSVSESEYSESDISLASLLWETETGYFLQGRLLKSFSSSTGNRESAHRKMNCYSYRYAGIIS